MLTNKALGLGKHIDETTFVQKILRSLPKWFHTQKVNLLETELHAMYERGSMCESEDEKESSIASLEVHVRDLMLSQEILLR